MIVVRNNIIPFKGFSAMNILGVLFVRKYARLSEVTINHEAIHTAQQYEIMTISALVTLVLSNIYASWWYLLIVVVMPIAIYLLSCLIELVLPPYSSAYKDSPFEREAYENQDNPKYLATRPLFAWAKHILKQR